MFKLLTLFFYKIKYRRILALMDSPTELRATNGSSFYAIDLPNCLESEVVSVSSTNRFIYLRLGLGDAAKYFRIMMPRKVRAASQKHYRTVDKEFHRIEYVCKYLRVETIL